MRITSKGQVTIPKRVRDALGLLPHTEVEFILEGGSARIVKVLATRGESRGQRALRSLRGRASITMSTDEILSLTREP